MKNIAQYNINMLNVIEEANKRILQSCVTAIVSIDIAN